MKKVIYKYSLNRDDAPELLLVGRNQPFKMKMHKGAEILTVQTQAEINSHGIPQATGKIWALCNPLETEKEDRTFMLIETGGEFDKTENTKYIGTYQVFGGEIILHLFEIEYNKTLQHG